MNNTDLFTLYSDHINADPFLSKSTKASYLCDVRNYIRFLDTKSVLNAAPDTVSDLIISLLQNHRSSSSVYRAAVSVRNFYKFLKAEGYVLSNPAKDFTNGKIQDLMETYRAE
ncbi:MAG: site-specific integrase [Oscillospiraceae bacterium]|nr:site-specific integrase [Oscillospiraceae bacterium]